MAWTIGKASELSGVSIETIRYYEREGITPKPPRTAGGRREYNHEIIARLRFVKRCRELGFSIADIRTLQLLSHTDEATCKEAGAIGNKTLKMVQSKIADLKTMEKALSEVVTTCGNGHKNCPMLQKLFAD